MTKSYANSQYNWPENSFRLDPAVHDQCLDEYVEGHWRIEDIKSFTGSLGISLRFEPDHSRKIFRRLLSHSRHSSAAAAEAVAFLDDLSLNTHGAGNYAIAVEHLVTQGPSPDTWSAFLGAVGRALSLGLIPPTEIFAILKRLSATKVEENGRGGLNPSTLVGYYGEIWDAIGRCGVFNHKNLRPPVINAFLEALWKIGPHEGGLSLAKQIILVSHGRHSQRRRWVPRFIIQCLLLSTKTNTEASGDYINKLLSHFSRRVVVEYAVCVTESLASSSEDKISLLERWRECLFRFRIIPDLAQSRAWYELRPCCTSGSNSALDGYSSSFSKSHQVILRLWILRNLSIGVADGQYWKWQTPDLAISYLFDFFYYMTRRSDSDHFLAVLMEGIHELGIPPSGLLIAAVDLKTPKTMTKSTRKYLQLLEGSDVTFSELFRDVNAFNATSRYFFSNYERLIRQIDVTSPSFIENSVSLASTGDSKSIWLLLRLLRSHTPLKIAISMAWRPVPHHSEMALVRWYPEPRTLGCPDPHTSLEVMNALAVAVSCSRNVSPRRAFQLVHWLYRFLKQHNAPVKPPLVRAMYHAGVVRYRLAGLNVPPGRYDYILDIVKESEDPAVVEWILAPPRFG